MYGFCIFLGIMCATLVGERLCKKHGLDAQVFWRMVFFALVFGLLGARLYHVIHRLDYFLVHPQEVFMVWQGGFGIWGAIFGGLFGLYLSSINLRKLGFAETRATVVGTKIVSSRKDAVSYLDIFAVCAPLAQAIGRWGNYFNKELFGFPTNLPWGIYIPPHLRPETFKYYDRFHPLFLYELLLSFGLFVLLYRIYSLQDVHSRQDGRSKQCQHFIGWILLPRGSFALLYLSGYAVIRFFLEFLRPNPWKVLNLPVASIVAIIVFSSSLTLFFIANIKANKRQHKKDNST